MSHGLPTAGSGADPAAMPPSSLAGSGSTVAAPCALSMSRQAWLRRSEPSASGSTSTTGNGPS